MNTDTIAAISTGLSHAGIGIVRLSGDNSFSIIEKVFVKGIHKFNVSKVDSHTVHYGHIVDNNEVIDEVMVLILKAPKTFTKENVVEINCHGGIFLLKSKYCCVTLIPSHSQYTFYIVVIFDYFLSYHQ